jgi:hypothetical protein
MERYQLQDSFRFRGPARMWPELSSAHVRVNPSAASQLS